jgi:hypothetical protein
MEIKEPKITIDTQCIEPTLSIRTDIEFKDKIYVPISISGKLFSGDGKVIAFINEYQFSGETYYTLKSLSKIEKERIKREQYSTTYYATLNATITSKVIDHIESIREKDLEKTARFRIEYIIKYLDIPAEPSAFLENDLIRINIKQITKTVEIKQSEWIRQYSPHLGIGNFLLLELNIPDYKNVTEFWKNLYEKLTENLKEIETCMQNGDWQKAMFCARKFYENAKIGDNKKGHTQFKDEFNKLMIKDQHSQQGIDDLHTAIWKMFEFTSKYVHDQNKEGDIKPNPISTKEDAYFSYAIALGLLNLIGKKMEEN